MSAISKLPFELQNLSRDLRLSSVPYSGWPPPSTLHSNRVHRNEDSSNTKVQCTNSISVAIDGNHQHRATSIRNKDTCYFEKLRSAAKDRSTPCMRTPNTSIRIESPLDDALENLIESIRPSTTEDFDDTKDNQSQVKLLRQIYIDNKMIKSIEQEEEESKQNTQTYFDNYTFSIMTPDGDILFDFSKQFINYAIHIQLMQLVRLSNVDKLVQKIFHKSGEYHHIDYKENRRRQLVKDQENHQYLLSDIVYPLQSSDPGKTNSYLTMAKAVHFRTSSQCFVLDGIDISSRFQYDRKIVQDICHRFHNDMNIDVSTKEKKNDGSKHAATLSDCIEHSAKTTSIIVLCTQRMKQIYRLLESLLRSCISPNISIIYITFDQIKPFLTEYEQISPETLPIDIPNSSDSANTPSMKVISDDKISNQSTSIDLEKNVNVDAKVMNGNTTATVLEENTLNKIDLFNEDYLLDCFRTASLILIFMKHLDESYLTALIHWYADLLSISDWSTVREYYWLITNDYQRAETILNIPTTNLFLWPTEHHEFDHISIILSSILCLPIALSMNYRNYSMFIDGMSIIDKHCQETTIDRNVCIQMALLRIWSSICEREGTVMITSNDDLQYFGEYITSLLAEYDEIYKRQTIETYRSIDGILSTKILLQQHVNEHNHFSYDLITIGGILSKTNIHDKEVSSPHTLILFDRLTPLTLGVLMGVYQMSIFFENVIRDDQNIPFRFE